MKKFLLAIALLALQPIAQAQVLDPGVALQVPEGPFGFGGRGVVFRAEENFSMTSFGMDLEFAGTLDLGVSVYAVAGTSRGALLSETLYPGMTDDGNDFLTLLHSQDFVAGNLYEVVFRFSDPGVIFPHYDFSNSSLDPTAGVPAGSSIFILDGSDFDNGFSNSWLARFEMNGASAAPTPVPAVDAEPVPVLSLPGLVVLAGLIAVVARRRGRRLG